MRTLVLRSTRFCSLSKCFRSSIQDYSDLIRLCPLTTLCPPPLQLQRKFHYIVNHSAKIFHVRLGVQHYAPTNLRGGGQTGTQKLEYALIAAFIFAAESGCFWKSNCSFKSFLFRPLPSLADVTIITVASPHFHHFHWLDNLFPPLVSSNSSSNNKGEKSVMGKSIYFQRRVSTLSVMVT